MHALTRANSALPPCTDSYRIFCGDLGKEVNDDLLGKAFKHYPSYQRARVVRNMASKKSRGYGFVAFGDGKDFLKAMTEMQGAGGREEEWVVGDADECMRAGKYVGNRPIKLRKGNWQERNIQRKGPKSKKGKAPKS